MFQRTFVATSNFRANFYLLHEKVSEFFNFDGGVRAMSRIDVGFARQQFEFIERLPELSGISTGQVGSPARTFKQRIPRDLF